MKGVFSMRSTMRRGLVVLLSLVAVVVLSSAAARAMEAVNADGCLTGRVGLSIQWADSLVTYACSVDTVADKTPSGILGVVVRWSDGSVSTVNLPTTQASAATTGGSGSATS